MNIHACPPWLGIPLICLSKRWFSGLICRVGLISLFLSDSLGSAHCPSAICGSQFFSLLLVGFAQTIRYRWLTTAWRCQYNHCCGPAQSPSLAIEIWNSLPWWLLFAWELRATVATDFVRLTSFLLSPSSWPPHENCCTLLSVDEFQERKEAVVCTDARQKSLILSVLRGMASGRVFYFLVCCKCGGPYLDVAAWIFIPERCPLRLLAHAYTEIMTTSEMVPFALLIQDLVPRFLFLISTCTCAGASKSNVCICSVNSIEMVTQAWQWIQTKRRTTGESCAQANIIKFFHSNDPGMSRFAGKKIKHLTAPTLDCWSKYHWEVKVLICCLDPRSVGVGVQSTSRFSVSSAYQRSKTWKCPGNSCFSYRVLNQSSRNDFLASDQT